MFARSFVESTILLALSIAQTRCFAPGTHFAPTRSGGGLMAYSSSPSTDEGRRNDPSDPSINRKELLQKAAASTLTLAVQQSLFVQPANAKCTDIESCREEGERRVEEDLKRNPIVNLSGGVRYRELQSSTSSSSERVREGSNIDLAYSISTAAGQYMYSKGFGYEKVEFGGRQVSDLGLDSLRVVVGRHDVPVGIEYALVGMGKGEKRRVELPPGVGFETSNWMPEPTTRRGKTQIELYKKKLTGFGSQPPFAAETVWDVEVLAVRN